MRKERTPLLGRPSCANLINRGLPFYDEKRKMKGEENRIVRCLRGAATPRRLCGQCRCPHNDNSHHGLIIPSARFFGKRLNRCVL